jgi:hypothetical protein
MSNWLQKIVPSLPAKQEIRRNLPAKLQQGSRSMLATLRKLEMTKGLPPATIVYGGAAGSLFAIAFYFLVTGAWVNGLLTLLPAACFLGFAMHLLKHGQ